MFAGFKCFLALVALLAFATPAFAQETAKAVSEQEEANNARLQALPPEIQKRIKERKRDIIKTRREIRSLAPEAKAELQAKVETWFRSLPLEKQIEIQIRMGGGTPMLDDFKEMENPISKDAAATATPAPVTPEAAPEVKAETTNEVKTEEPAATPAPAAEATDAPKETTLEEGSKPAVMPESEKASMPDTSAPEGISGEAPKP